MDDSLLMQTTGNDVFANTTATQFMRTLGHLYPFYSGCGTIANAGPFISASEKLPHRMATTIRGGVRIVVNPREFLGRSVFFTGEWDPKITWACRRLLRPGDTFLDIGAHCGVTALVAARQVGRTGRVHAFEPQIDLGDMLAESAALNGFDHLTLHRIALSNGDGKAEITLASGKQILASLERGGEGRKIEIETCETARYLSTLELGSIRLIKIDVEGHELTILESGKAFFDSCPPTAILFESIEAEGTFTARPVVVLLARRGYRFYALPKNLVRMKAIAVSDNPPPGVHDFVAIRAGANDAIEALLR